MVSLEERENLTAREVMRRELVEMAAGFVDIIEGRVAPDELEEDGEPWTVWGWLNRDALEVEYRMGLEVPPRGRARPIYRGAVVVLTIGGPHVEVRTSAGWAHVHATWGTVRIQRSAQDSIGLDEALAESFESIMENHR